MSDSPDDGTRIIHVTRVVKIPLPKELQALAALSSTAITALVMFAENPREFIFRFVSEFVVSSVFGLFGIIVEWIQAAFDLVVLAVDGARSLAIGAFAAVGVDILGALVAVQQQLAAAVATLGPAAPLVAVAAGSVAIYVVARLGIGLLGELPLGSTIVDLLRLR